MDPVNKDNVAGLSVISKQIRILESRIDELANKVLTLKRIQAYGRFRSGGVGRLSGLD